MPDLRFFRRAPQNCIPANALAVFAAPRRYTPFPVFNHYVGSCYPHARNYAICWPSSHTEYRPIALLVAVLVTTFKSLTSKVKVITRGEATRLINKEDAVVVDLRQRDDFRKGHIAGSINLLPSEIKANNVGELEKHKDKPVIVVDGSGMQCREPANALTKAGFAQVFVLKEGVAGWAGENLPLVRGK